MPHGTEGQLEESHHAEHASHDEFTRRVAMTMAIVAASLAFVTLLSHQAHNETLQKRIDASVKKTEAANRWTQYQAKSSRRSQLEADVKMLAALAMPENRAQIEKVSDEFKAEIKRYRTPAGEEEDPVEKPEMDGLKKMAEKLDEKAKEFNEESDHIHHLAAWIDKGELGTELALVLCSIAVLTKRGLFWLAGIGVGVAGVVVALTAIIPFVLYH